MCIYIIHIITHTHTYIILYIIYIYNYIYTLCIAIHTVAHVPQFAILVFHHTPRWGYTEFRTREIWRWVRCQRGRGGRRGIAFRGYLLHSQRFIWLLVKTLAPSEPQNSWDLWMFIPLELIIIGFDPPPIFQGSFHGWDMLG